eukprot:7294211-Pyramimonas_sp.AAC.1
MLESSTVTLPSSELGPAAAEQALPSAAHSQSHSQHTVDCRFAVLRAWVRSGGAGAALCSTQSVTQSAHSQHTVSTQSAGAALCSTQSVTVSHSQSQSQSVTVSHSQAPPSAAHRARGAQKACLLSGSIDL